VFPPRAKKKRSTFKKSRGTKCRLLGVAGAWSKGKKRNSAARVRECLEKADFTEYEGERRSSKTTEAYGKAVQKVEKAQWSKTHTSPPGM